MKIRFSIATVALIALTLSREQGIAAASNYTLIQLDAGIDVGTSVAEFISDNGVVAGRTHKDGESHAFVWTKELGFVPLNFGGPNTYIMNISRNDTVVGYRDLPDQSGSRGFVWSAAGGVRDIGTLGGTATIPHGVNNNGLVVGEARLPGRPDARVRLDRSRRYLRSRHARRREFSSVLGE